jgi:membrane protease YdiL (CAAX protease family)
MPKTKNILFFVLYVVIFLTFDTMWYGWIEPNIRVIKNNEILFELLWILGKTLLWIVPVFLYLKYIDSAQPFSYLKLKNNQFRGVCWGLIFGFSLMGLRLLQDFYFGNKSFNLNIGTYYWIGGMLVGFFEEIPFRGFILQKIEGWTNFWKANLMTTFLFTIYHFPKWIFQGGFSPVNIGFVFCYGLVWSFVFKKTNSLWSVIIFHSINNLISSMGIGV